MLLLGKYYAGIVTVCTAETDGLWSITPNCTKCNSSVKYRLSYSAPMSFYQRNTEKCCRMKSCFACGVRKGLKPSEIYVYI